MLKHLKTISSTLLVAALVASCGSGGKKSTPDTPKAIQELEAEKQKILAAYEQLLDLDANEKELALEVRELEWIVSEDTSNYKLVEFRHRIAEGIMSVERTISNLKSIPTSIPYPMSFVKSPIPCNSYTSLSKDRFKPGERIAGLQKELEWLKLLKKRCEYKLGLNKPKA